MVLNEAMNELNMDSEKILRRCGGNSALLHKFMKKFIDDETFNKLAEALSNKQADEIEIQAHTLKGIAMNLGFDALGAKSAAIVECMRSNDSECLCIEKAGPLFDSAREEHEKIINVLNQMD